MYLLQNVKNWIARIFRVRLTLVLACLVIAITSSCSHPGQVTLQIGQCVLDNGILGQVFAALGQPDFEQEVAEIALRHASDLVDCALRAIAAQSTSAGSGAAPLSAPAEAPPIQVLRAREILTRRSLSSGGGGR